MNKIKHFMFGTVKRSRYSFLILNVLYGIFCYYGIYKEAFSDLVRNIVIIAYSGALHSMARAAFPRMYRRY